MASNSNCSSDEGQADEEMAESTNRASNGDISANIEHLSSNSQSEEDERRILRARIRAIQSEMTNPDEDDPKLVAVSTERLEAQKIKGKIDEVEAYFEKVKFTREAALDDHVYSLIASAAKQHIQGLQTNLLEFDPEEFAESLKTHFGVDRIENPFGLPDETWIKVGRDNSKYFRRTPPFHFVAGTFDPGELAPKVVTRRPRAPKDTSNDKATIVEKVSIADTKKESTTEEVESLYKLLQQLYLKNDRLAFCYFKFVIDPTSFPRTIENIFHVSFLVKDGHARVFYDEYGLPVIEPAKKKTVNEAGQENEKLALALGLSIPEWQEIVKVFKITKAAIPWKNRPA